MKTRLHGMTDVASSTAEDSDTTVDKIIGQVMQSEWDARGTMAKFSHLVLAESLRDDARLALIGQLRVGQAS